MLIPVSAGAAFYFYCAEGKPKGLVKIEDANAETTPARREGGSLIERK